MNNEETKEKETVPETKESETETIVLMPEEGKETIQSTEYKAESEESSEDNADPEAESNEAPTEDELEAEKESIKRATELFTPKEEKVSFFQRLKNMFSKKA